VTDIRLGGATARNLLPPAITRALLLLAWEAYSRIVLDAIPGGSRLLPAPTSVLAALVTNANDLAINTWHTVLETMLGLVLALVVGFGFAVIIDLSPIMRRAIYPLLVVSQTIPLLALAPLLVLWFGFGILPKILVVGLVCFFPIVVSGVDGFRATDPELIRLFRTFGAGKWSIFKQVRLPGALPSLFSGVRIAVTYCVIGAVWGEYVGAQYGLGIFMQSKQHAFDVATVFACVVVISAISIALFLLTSLIERAVIPWYFRAGERSTR
jgi:ABC-type nitrate/sulfonate/bicarbonate transport system permease component